MIKRTLFATRLSNLPADEFLVPWSSGFATLVDAPRGPRPSRAAVCTALPSVLANPKHDGFGLAWFADADHLARYEEWCRDSSAQKDLEDVLDLDNSPVVVAEEHVMRGADWLDE